MDDHADVESVKSGPFFYEMHSLSNHNSDQQPEDGISNDEGRAEKTTSRIMFEENSDIFDMPLDDSKDIVRSPRTQSVKINGRRERIASVALEVINDEYIRYRRQSKISILRTSKQDGSATLASAFLEEEAFSTVIFMNPLSEERNFFEVEITAEGANGVFAVGIGPKKYPLTVMPGWIEDSFGYHANGNLFIEQGDTPIKGPRCTKGDHMGCGLDFSTVEEGYVQVWFTKNGRLACWPEKVPFHAKLALYPIISVGSSGEVVHYCAHGKQAIPDVSTIYPWYVVEGFTDTSEVPFYSREESILSYDLWSHPEITDASKSDAKMSWDELRDGLWHTFPEQLHILGELSPSSYAEWLEMAENALRGSEKYAKLGKAPNGQQFKKNEQLALFLAQEVLSTLENLNSGFNLKNIAILAYLSLGIVSPYQNVSIVGGLLYIGCSANSSTKCNHIFHNSDISISLVQLLLNWGGNPNVPDVIGRTPLHIHQNNRALMRTFLSHNADVNALDDERNTPLHYAGFWGRSGVADLLIQNGASPSASFGGRPTSLDVAASAGHHKCFRHMLKMSVKTITGKKVQQQMIEDKWKDAVSDLPKWKKVKQKEIEEMSNDEFYYVTVKQHETDDDKYSVKKLVSVAHEKKIVLKSEVLTAIFDRCAYGQNMVIADILDADVNGNIDPETSNQDEGTTLLTYLSKSPKLLLSLVSHETLKAYISDQWKKKALLIFWFRTLFFFFQLILLTFALAIAARPRFKDKDLHSYTEPIDIFRAVCELLIILLMIIKMFDEAFELILGGIMEYIMDVTNYIQWLGIIFILLIIPLRVINHPAQWIIASLAYMAFAMRALYFASLFDSTGSYVQALGIIVSRDVIKFLSMFFIVLVVFGGAFYFSLRYDESIIYLTPANESAPKSSFHPGETTYLHEVYLSGLRTMIESGPTIDYYEDHAFFGVLAVIWYLLFLFIVVIVLLNVLIAQVSDTYAKVLEKAEGFKLFNQCIYIAKLEEQNNKMCMTHGLFMFIHRFSMGKKLYNTCCKCSCLENCSKSCFGSKTTRPRILTTGTNSDKTGSQFGRAKKKFQQVVAHYFPDTLRVADTSEGTGEEDLELKVDATNQNLKEMGQELHASLMKQQEQFATLMTNNMSLLMSELSFQKNKIQADITISEEQEGLMVHFLTQLKEMRKAMVQQMEDMKEQNLADQAYLKEKLAEMRRKQDDAQVELTMQQSKLQEEVTRQQLEVKAQLSKQDEDLRHDIEDHQRKLQLQLLSQEEELKALLLRQDEAREYFSDKQSELDMKITKQQDEVRCQLVSQNADMKKDIVAHQERLHEVMGKQREELKALSQQQEKSREFLLTKQEELDSKLSTQQRKLQEDVVKQQEALMSEFPRQKEELVRLITDEMVTINKDFLYLYETTTKKDK